MSCPYCHEDRDGYIWPLEKNCHAYLRFPNKLVVKFGMRSRECEIQFCPMCGRKLKEET